MNLSLVRGLWRLGILALGAMLTVVACLQQSMSADGLNYLTVGSSYWNGDWQQAINGIWSPLYGVIVAGVLELARPPIPWVFPTVQVVNLAIFALSLACFERLWRELRTSHEAREPASSRDVAEDSVTLPPWVWWSIGYALFVWAALDLIEIWAVTPDMLVACAVYLSASYLVQIARGDRRAMAYVMLGAVLGVGYLAKAPLFPLGLVAFGLTALVSGPPREAARKVLLTLAAFALVAGPFLTALSIRQGRATFSEVSRFTYLKHVNRIPFPHWRDGVVDGVGTPVHPPRLVHAQPDVYSYAGPVGGAYPPSFDPDYWTEGLTPKVDLFQQVNEVSNGLAFYFGLFFREQGAFLGVFTLVALLGVSTGGLPRWHQGHWELSAWALACFAMYSLVFVTERYVAPFVVLSWAGLLSYWRLRPSDLAGRFSTAAGTLLAALALANVVALCLAGFTGVLGFRPPIEAVRPGQFQDGGSASPPAVAMALRDAGLEPGTDVAYIGYSYTAFWAYLADVRIVAEIWPEQAPLFWRADGTERGVVLQRFGEAGARYAISEMRAERPQAEFGWSPLGGTGYLFRVLDRP